MHSTLKLFCSKNEETGITFLKWVNYVCTNYVKRDIFMSNKHFYVKIYILEPPVRMKENK